MADKKVLDAALIASAQAVEHYEITRYGTLIAWAKQLGHTDCVSLLQQTLGEEEATDKKLTAMAERHVNQQAAEGTDRHPDGRHTLRLSGQRCSRTLHRRATLLFLIVAVNPVAQEVETLGRW